MATNFAVYIFKLKQENHKLSLSTSVIKYTYLTYVSKLILYVYSVLGIVYEVLSIKPSVVYKCVFK